MNSKNDNVTSTIIIAIALIGSVAIWRLLEFLGADFASSTQMLLFLAASLAAAIFYGRRPDSSLLGAIAVFLILAWPSCWPVIDNIAIGDQDSESAYPFTQRDIWWAALWAKAAFETAFAVFAVFMVRKDHFSYNYPL
jgi:hypothetical protein